MQQFPRSGTREMPNLDLLRSIAVTLVVVEHILLAMHLRHIIGLDFAWLGVVGVFMFFVHTSLVLMWSIERKPQVLGFYIRRFFRIYPLAVAAILVTVMFHIPTLQNIDGDTFYQAPSFKNLVENLLLIQNLGHAPSILGVMWTLPPELDMYLLLPFLFFFLRQNFLLWPLFLVWSVSAAYAFSLFPSNNSTFLVCIPYFLSGVISYVLFSKVRARLPAFLMPVLVAVLLCGFMVHPSWPMGWALTLTLGLALPFFRQIRAKWLIRCSHQMAKYSYGIYLAHPFCIAIGINLLHRYNLTIRIAAIVFSLALIVVITFHLLEKPMMDFGASLAARVEAPKAQPAILSQ